MASQDASGLFGPFAEILQFWANFGRGAPNSLTQPILPDWSLIRIDETNSSAPATEQAIVQQQSYGRQLGRVMDALAELIDRQPDGREGPEAFKAFQDLKADIDAIKRQQATDRIGKLAGDLDLLRRTDPAGYKQALESVREAMR